jgi:SAM-dependent methyltransferase
MEGVARFEPLHPTFRKQCLRYGFPYFSEAETLNEAEYMCPRCGAFDRTRLHVLFLDEVLAELPQQRPLRLLHVAPEIGFERWLARQPQVERVTMNVSHGAADLQVDLCAMPQVRSASFDFFICSHVLEHVADDRAAMAELHRVLVPGGWGIAMVPLYPGRVHVTDEDPGERSQEERIRRFGKDDHVRLYAKADFLTRLAQAGFSVDQLGDGHFGAQAFASCGIAPGSVLYVVRKA